jgi:Flp pilus assembly protein TadD
MSYLKRTGNGPVKLSVIIASLLSANCADINLRTGLFFDAATPKNPTTQVSQETHGTLNQKPLSLVDAENYNMAENLSPDDPKLILSEAAKIAFKDEKYSESLKYWTQLINQYPDYAQGYIGYSQAGRKLSLHRSILAKLYEFKNRYPQDVSVVTEIAKVHYETKDYRQALKEIDNVINIQSSDWKIYSLRGVINDKLQYYTEAKASYNKALELSPDNSVVLNNMAVSMMMSGHYDDAQTYAEKAIEDPNVNIQAFRTYAKILVLKGEAKHAEEVLTEKLDSSSKAREIINSVALEVSKPALWGRK